MKKLDTSAKVLIGLFLAISFIHCKKTFDTDNCAEILQVKIAGAKPSYFAGDTIQLHTSRTPEGTYTWTQTNADGPISGSDHVLIKSCTKNDGGWYYVSVSSPNCASHTDSVLISVVNKPATAPCNPDNNAVSFSTIPSVSFVSVAYAKDPTHGLKMLSGHPGGAYPDLDVYFNPAWNDKEPEDGAYTLGTDLSFSGSDPNTVYITSNYSGVSFKSEPGTVYISHPGGKLQVTFCSLNFSGDFAGHTYATTASGRLTAP